MCMTIFLVFISIASASEISGTKWNDIDGNGTMDNGELGVFNVSICLYSNINNIICTTTDLNGNYSFTGLPASTYYVYEIVPSGTVQTYPAGFMGGSNWSMIGGGALHFVTLTSNDEIIDGINFGNRNLIPPPPDVTIEQQYGSQDGIPTILRPSLTNLNISKDLSSTHR